MVKTPRATIDFETRSTVSLKRGTWRYSLHPTTDILCLAWRLPHWPSKKTALWHPAFPLLNIPEASRDTDYEELCQWIADGNLIEAHMSWFEFCIWKHIAVPRYGFPPIKRIQWRCSAAQAAAVSLPRGLDDALKAIQVSLRKDAAGSKVMKKMTKPRKPRKKEREEWAASHGEETPHETLYWETPELLQQLFDYCRQDVLAEEGLSHVLPDLSDAETDLFLLDQRLNERGFKLDRLAVKTALALLAKEGHRLNNELALLTKGAVLKATQRARLLKWLKETQDLDLPNTTAETLDDYLKSDYPLTPDARRALEILRMLGRSSTAKYEAMRDWMDDRDGRVRGGLLYHGASTGRWSGKGVQPHNFPKGTLKDASKPNGKVDIEELWTILKAKNRGKIRRQYGATIMEALAHALRGTIIARQGYELFVADFAAIEARVLLWLADDQDALAVFRNHQDIYCDMATSIYGYVVDKKKHPVERGMGKIAILGLGYQMGWAKFLATCDHFGITIDEEFAQRVVTAYREKYWRVKQLWYDQEAAAVKAVETGKIQQCGKIIWKVEGKFLYARLPNGRRLAYVSPQVKDQQTSWGEVKPTLSYMSIDSYTHQWRRQTTYGGMLVENLTQAVARDLLAEALVRCENTGIYLPILSVHDELLIEAVKGFGMLEEFIMLMKTVPKWARGCPIDVDAWSGVRYQKS